MSKGALTFCDVEEAQIAGVEKSDAEWEPGAHYEVLNFICNDNRHGCAYWVDNLSHAPVQMEKDDSSKCQWETSNFQDGQMAVIPAETHSR